MFQEGKNYYKTGNYNKAIVKFQQAAAIYKTSNSVLYAYSLLNLTDILKVSGNYASALLILKQTDISQFKKTKDAVLLNYEYENKIGSLLFLLGKSDEAFNKLNNIFKKIKGQENSYPDIALKVYNNLGAVLEAKNRMTDALNFYFLALKLSKKFNKTGINTVSLFQNIGKLYLLTGKIDSSRFYYNKSINLIKTIYSNNDPQLGFFYSNLGIFYRNIGLISEALYYYSMAENILTKSLGKNDPRLDLVYSNMGNIFMMQGDYERALDYFSNSLRLFNTSKSNDIIKKINILKNLANLYFYTTDYENSFKNIKECIELAQRIQGIRIELPYKLLAKYYIKVGDVNKAKENYLLYLENLKSVYGETSPATASGLLSIGQFYLLIQDYYTSKQYLGKAHTIFLNSYGKNNPNTAQALTAFGDYYMQIKNYNLSVKYYSDALASFNININTDDWLTMIEKQNSSSTLMILNNLRKLGYALLKLSEIQKRPKETLKNALEVLEASIKLGNRLQSGYLSEESKLFIASDLESTIAKTIFISISLFKLTNNQEYLSQAFYYTEKKKSTVLLSSLRDMEAKLFGNIPEKYINKEKKIEEEKSIYKELIFKEQQKENPDKKMILLWQDHIFELVREKEKLLKNYEKEYPAYFNSRFENEPITVKSLQSEMKRNECLINYFLNDTCMVSTCITKRKISYDLQILDSSFYPNSEWLIKFLTSSNLSKDLNYDFIKFTTISKSLYTLLLIKHIEQIKSKHLIIIPDNILAFIPFEIIISELPKSKRPDYRKLSYLMKQNIIRYSYSATLAYTKFSSSKRTKNKVLAIAPSYENLSLLPESKAMAIREYKDILIPLPGVDKEVQMVGDFTKAKILKGANATEKNFKQLASDYRILHLAMHTIIDNSNPLYSKLVFTFNNDTVEDGMLNTFELYNISLNSKLAVLSACNTGFGRIQKGEGVMSLARGFIYAGCPNIVMTLWALEDKAGLSIMTQFYKNLRKGISSDKALNKAKLNYLERADKLKAHPYFWSAYVLIGNNSAIYTRNNLIYILSGIVLLVLVILLFMRYKWRKHKINLAS